MPHISLVALIGLPGAGKSTLCTWLLGQQTGLRARHLVHLCYDDFLDVQPTPTSAVLPYKGQRAFIFTLLEQIIAAIRTGAPWPKQVRRRTSAGSDSSGDYLILCDDNFYYRSMRYKLYQLCREAGCGFGQIHLASSLDYCLRANARRSGDDRVPNAVVREMHERMEPPGSEAWERNSLAATNADHDEVAGRGILNFINSLNVMPVAEKLSPEAGQQPPQGPSLVHSLDLLLRKRIKELLQELTDKRTASGRLNEERKRILARFRADEGAGRRTDLDYYVHCLN